MDHAAADARRLPLAVIASHRRDMTGRVSQAPHTSKGVREPTGHDAWTLALVRLHTLPSIPAHHLAHAGPPTATWPRKDDLVLVRKEGC